jgi:two-component system response regulator YesN
MQYSHHCIKVEGSPLSWIFDKEQLIDAILIGNSSVAQQLLEKFFSHVSQLPAPQDIYLTPLLSELIGATTVSLLQHGIEYDLKAFSLVVQKHSTIHEAQIHITEYIQSLIDSIQSRELAKNYQIVHRMISFTKEHFSEGITLSEIADQLQFTPNYLSTLFAKSMGINFSQYLAKLRIFKAKELLDSGKYKVYEVGDLVGYKNPEYFTKVFKEFVGITPSAYAK